MPLNADQIKSVLSTSDWELKPFVPDILKLNVGQGRKIVDDLLFNLVNKDKARQESLELLTTVAEAGNLEASEAWEVLSVCLARPIASCKEQELLTLTAILDHVPEVDEFHDQLEDDYLKKIVEACVSTTLESVFEVQAALGLLTSCLKYYGDYLGEFKTKIEKFLVKMLDSDDQEVVQKAAHTFLYLQQVGDGGVDGQGYVDNFSRQFGRLCSTAHSLYDVLFNSIKEKEPYDNYETESPFTFNCYTSDSLKTLYDSTKRLRNCLCYLKYMISKKFPVRKETKPKEILDVVIRGLAVHQCLAGDVATHTYHFTLLLNVLQKDLLHLLQLVINGYQTHLLPFSFTINKLLADCLKRIQRCDCFKNDCGYKRAIYKTIIAWLKIAKTAINKVLQKGLVAAILCDISPIKKQKAKPQSKAKSGKNQSLSPFEVEYSEESRKQALNCLKYLFRSNSFNLAGNILQGIYKAVLVRPYNNTECQKLVYEVVVAIYDDETLSTYPPLQLSIDLLHRGANSFNRSIASTCEMGLNNLERLCQPICPSILSPILNFNFQELNVHEDSTLSLIDEDVVEEVSEEVVPKIIIISDQLIRPAFENKEQLPEPKPIEVVNETPEDSKLVITLDDVDETGITKKQKHVGTIIDLTVCDDEPPEPPKKKSKPETVPDAPQNNDVPDSPQDNDVSSETQSISSSVSSYYPFNSFSCFFNSSTESSDSDFDAHFYCPFLNSSPSSCSS